MWFEITTSLWLTVSTGGMEGDGSYNQLLQSSSRNKQFSIAVSTKKPIPFTIGQWFKADVQMECSSMWYLDEDIASTRMGGYGAPRGGYVCNADKIEVYGVKYEVLDRSKDTDEQGKQSS